MREHHAIATALRRVTNARRCEVDSGLFVGRLHGRSSAALVAVNDVELLEELAARKREVPDGRVGVRAEFSCDCRCTSRDQTVISRVDGRAIAFGIRGGIRPAPDFPVARDP